MTQDVMVKAPSWRRRHGATLVVVGAFLVAVVVAELVGRGAGGHTARYDPDNPGPDGTRALAKVLEHQGVDVTVVRSANAFDRVNFTAQTSVVVTSTGDLGEDTVQRMVHHVFGALILVDPESDLLSTIGADAEAEHVRLQHGLAAGCGDDMFQGLTLRVDTAVVYDSGSGCFVQGIRSVVQQAHGVTIFGGGEAMTNDQILRGDNAAVSLRLLGQTDRLVWYVPRLDDVRTGDGFGVESLIPRWIRPGLWLIAIAVIVLALWRGRRLGPLSTEPLPVVVKAIETTLSRGRLYRKANDRAHAATALRSAARVRAARRLGLGVGHDQDELIRGLARRSGRPESDISALISSAAEPPTTDRDLIKLARDLTELDEEVRHP